MKNNIFFIIAFLAFGIGYSQQTITWQDLSYVKFTDKYFEKYDANFLYPEFLDPVKKLEGQKVTIQGYFLDLDPEGEIFVLSKGPMSSCFFCGVGGPETAIELVFKNKPSFKQDNIIAVTGVLKLNKDDVEHFNYILTDCTAILIQ